MMAGTDLALLIGFAALGSVIPPLVLRRRRSLWLAFDAGSWAFALALAIISPRFGISMDPDLALIGLIWARLGVFCALVAGGSTADRFRLTPLIAALLAGSLYLMFVPHVLRWPVDGDEPYYVLMAESLAQDHDLDLRNQYDHLDRSVTARPDLEPQFGDPLGRDGERYSRHEPLLAILLLPGLLVGGLPGAVATMALIGAALVWSIMSLLEEEGIPWPAAVAAYPFIAFGPPVLFYSTRIWTEVPAALCLSEALRASRRSRWPALMAWLLALSLLKLRFIPIAVTVLAVVIVRSRAGWKRALAALGLVGVPMLVVWLSSGTPTSVHRLSELEPQALLSYVRGTVGLLLDGQAGILFQAPFWLFGLGALVRWRDTPRGFRDAAIAAVPYLVLLVPRAEWHGGWSPPLRYLVVFAPLFALGGAWMIERTRIVWIAIAAIWTAVIAVHGMAFPWRLFHIANGESVAGEMLSTMFRTDFSRLIPSLVRLNAAVLPWTVGLVVICIIGAVPGIRARLRAIPSTVIVVAITALMVTGVRAGVQPGHVVQFEDSHVIKQGGSLYPEKWTVARFRFSGGWELGTGDSVNFLWRGGPSVLRYSAPRGATIRLGGVEVALPPTGESFETTSIELPHRSGRWRLVCIGGALNVDWIRDE